MTTNHSTPRENFLKKKPTRVVWFGAGSSTMHTFCFIGTDGVPKYAKEALARVVAAVKMNGAQSKQVADACRAKDLRDYFETNDVAEVLGLNLARKTAQEVISSCESAQVRAPSAPAKARPPVRGGSAEAPAAEDDAELAEIEQMLAADREEKPQMRGIIATAQTERAPQFANGEWTLVTEAQMFPEDSIADVKRKIFVHTHIPTYRQHIASVSADGAASISYSVSTTGAHVIDFKDLYCRARAGISLFDIPIDRAIYDAREDIRVEARDHITTIDQSRPNFFIVLDIANWITPNIEQLRAALADNYQFELLYYGFVVKFFPQLTRECFHAYVTNEGEMSDRFPDLAPSWSAVRNAVSIQCRISNDTYVQIIRKRNDIDHIILRATMTSQAIGIPLRPINLRDFFDSLVCSATILDVRAIVDSAPLQREHREVFRYELRKFYKHSELMSALVGMTGRIVNIGMPAKTPGTSLEMNVPQRGTSEGHSQWSGRVPSLGGEPGLIVTYMTEIPMFMIVRANGSVSFQFQWREEDEIDFAQMMELFKEHTAQLIKEMRNSGVFAAANIEPVTDANMRVRSLTVAVRWKRTISTKHFRILREMWGDYIRAGIIIPHQPAKDVFSFIFTRGVQVIDSQQLEQRLSAANISETNHYAYLSVSAMRQKWVQNFAGRVVHVAHRATDVRFDVSDIYEREYDVFEMYLTAFIASFERAHGAEILALGTETDTSLAPERRKLRRLQEIDPVLYNLKKHGAPRVYSTRCQRGKQPVLYSEHEVASRKISRAVKYWNFTLQRPAYYACPDAKYPFLNFIVDVHPRGFCIPCCGKMKPTPGSKHAQIEKICLSEHVFDVSKLIEQPVGYIMSFGKDLPEGRLSHLPAGYLRDTLNRAVSADHPGSELLIFGVPQGIGIVHTIRAILDLSLKDFISAIVRNIEKGAISFDTLAGGRAATYFASKRAFAGYIAQIAQGAFFPEGTGEFMRVVITDCVRATFGLEMVYLRTAEQAQDMRIIMNRGALSQNDTKTGFAVIGQDESVHPVLAIHPDDFARDGSISSRLLIRECYAIMKQIASGFEEHRMKTIDLEFMRTFCAATGSVIKKLYIGLRGLCYGVLIESDAKMKQYVPMTYSSNIQKKPEEEIGFDSLDDAAKLTASECKRAIDAINDYIVRGRLAYYKLVIEHIVATEASGDSAMLAIGFLIRAGVRMIAYFGINDLKRDDASGHHYEQAILAIDPRKHARMLLATSTAPSAAGHTFNPVIARIINAAQEQMFPYFEYELFCVQFMSQVAKMRNETVRSRIRAILESSSKTSFAARREALNDLNLSKRDLALVIGLLQDQSRASRSRARFDRMALEIDLDELYKNIETLGKHTGRESESEGHADDLAQWIVQFMAPIVTKDEEHAARVPTVIVPCDGTPKEVNGSPRGDISKEVTMSPPSQGAISSHARPHCKDSRLIIQSDIMKLASILASDLRNPLKRAYILTRGATPESRSSFADFTQRPNEVLLMKKHEILP